MNRTLSKFAQKHTSGNPNQARQLCRPALDVADRLVSELRDSKPKLLKLAITVQRHVQGLAHAIEQRVNQR